MFNNNNNIIFYYLITFFSCIVCVLCVFVLPYGVIKSTKIINILLSFHARGFKLVGKK